MSVYFFLSLMSWPKNVLKSWYCMKIDVLIVHEENKYLFTIKSINT